MNTETLNLSRKERERHLKRQEIVNAARIVFARHGFTAATLDEIAERAEFGKGTLYNYFQNKEELFETVIADAIDEFIEVAMETCTDDTASLQSSYMSFARRLLGHLLENWSIYGLVMREFHKMESNPHLATLFPNLLLILARPLDTAIRKGEIPPIPSHQVGMMFLSMVLSLFKSNLHLHHQEVFGNPDKPISMDDASTQQEIENSLCILERTFFNGIFASGDQEEKGWCFNK
jgi:AcrR family transcriptional regulator